MSDFCGKHSLFGVKKGWGEDFLIGFFEWGWVFFSLRVGVYWLYKGGSRSVVELWQKSLKISCPRFVLKKDCGANF